MNQATTDKTGERPSILTSKRPQTRPERSRPLSTTWSTSAGTRVSACRKSSTSLDACSAPAFICSARPRDARMTRSARGRARCTVASRLPPSTTMTPVPRARRSASASSAAAMPSPSSSTGMMIDSFDMRQGPACMRGILLHGGRPAPRRSSGGRGGLRQRAAATRSLAGGAAITVARDPDRPTFDIDVEQIGQVHAFVRAVLERQIEHLVEIAIVDVAAPVDRNQISAHDAVEVGVEVRAAEQIQVAIELAVGQEGCAEALDRHVGERVEPVENNPIALAEDAPVILLKRLLRRRQR